MMMHSETVTRVVGGQTITLKKLGLRAIVALIERWRTEDAAALADLLKDSGSDSATILARKEEFREQSGRLSWGLQQLSEQKRLVESVQAAGGAELLDAPLPAGMLQLMAYESWGYLPDEGADPKAESAKDAGATGDSTPL